jgi:hypothetical protein
MRTLAGVASALLTALALAATTAGAHDVGPGMCMRPFTPQWQSPWTGHIWRDRAIWQINAGGPYDGYYILMQHEWTAGYTDGWHVSYWTWRHCY